MKDFFRIFISILISFFVIIAILSLIGYIAFNQNTKSTALLDKEKVIYLNLDYNPKEYYPSNRFDAILKDKIPLSLFELENALEAAISDDRIKGVLINGTSQISHNTAFNLLPRLEKLKASGKFIYAYGDYYTQNAYLLSTVSDSIFLNPNGMVDYKGYGFSNFYLKDFFAKYQIEPQLFVAGKFKSFGEMYVRNESSEENNLQVRRILEQTHQELDGTIARNRNISIEQCSEIRENFTGFFPKDALYSKLIDKITYSSEFNDILTEKVGEKTEDALVTIERYAKSVASNSNDNKKAEYAILFAEGEIKNAGTSSDIDLSIFKSAIRKIREDKNIKALILRINSPGGSATASDELYNEIKLCREAGIPVIVSMGAIAGSGGYYIACPANKIFAEPSTITGSIGVIGLQFGVEKALEENFDVHIDYERVSPYSLMNNMMVPLSEAEKALFQKSVETMYMQFKNCVADGREMSIDQVEEIAQGRIWSGIDAQQNGLVDTLGSLMDAISFVQQTYDVEKSAFDLYPKSEVSLQDNFTNAINFQVKNNLKNTYILKTINDFDLLEKKELRYMRTPFFKIE